MWGSKIDSFWNPKGEYPMRPFERIDFFSNQIFLTFNELEIIRHLLTSRVSTCVGLINGG